MSAMIFLEKSDVLEMQRRSIEAFGGIHGLRDDGALESALLAAKNRAYYEGADLAQCAATYAFHLTQAHAFLDGNKRVAAIASEAFIELNGARLNVSNDEIVELFLAIAASEKSREQVEEFFAARLMPLHE